MKVNESKCSQDCCSFIIFFGMSRLEAEKPGRKQKSIKNIYIHKINSLLKIVGDSNCSLPCLNKVRKTIFSQSLEHLMMQRKENNKDAARKARLRKKLYMELLEQTIENLKEMNEEGKRIEKASNDLISSLGANEVEAKDEIDQYFTEMGSSIPKKDISQVTLDGEKGGDLNKIMIEIEMLAFPREWTVSNLKGVSANPETHRLLSRIEGIEVQLPQIFTELKKTCSQHNSLLFVSSSKKNEDNFDPYFCKTLMQQYYSKTICKKDVSGTEISKSLDLLARMDRYEWKANDIAQCDILEN